MAPFVLRSQFVFLTQDMSSLLPINCEVLWKVLIPKNVVLFGIFAWVAWYYTEGKIQKKESFYLPKI